MLVSGVYTIDPDGASGYDPFQAYCDMTAGGGGWTLLMKIDGTKTTFGYNASFWTDNAFYQTDHPGLDHAFEAKLTGFMNQPFNAVRVGMYDPSDTTERFLDIPQSKTSLSQLFLSGTLATTFGVSAWEGLVASPSLQTACTQEGFNLGAASTAARIGIVGDDDADCMTPESRIGIGTGGAACGQVDGDASGDEAYCTPDHGNRSTPTFGYLFVRNCPAATCACGALTACGPVCCALTQTCTGGHCQ